MNVLLTNDDGVQAPGLRAIFAALRRRGHSVLAVAPMRQQSAVSRCLTVFEPLRSQKMDEPDFEGIGVHGTPADCVKLGLAEFMPSKPDIVISGINMGRNVGPDIFYSGTVAAAAEGAHAGHVALALSRAGDALGDDIQAVAEHAAALAEQVCGRGSLAGKVVNVNYPACPLKDARGPRLCPQSLAVWRNVYSKKEDPRGWPYWWLVGDMDKDSISRDSDLWLLNHDFITVTPLKFDLTDHGSMSALLDMEMETKN